MENSNSLFEHFSFTVDKGQSPLRIDKYLMNFVENATRTKIQVAAKSGSIQVNGNGVKSNYNVKPEDKIKVLFEYPPHENLLLPENIDLDIVYEDKELVVLNKPAGMVVHPGHGNYSGTLINALIYHFDNLPNNSSKPAPTNTQNKTPNISPMLPTQFLQNHVSKQTRITYKTPKTIHQYVHLTHHSAK